MTMIKIKQFALFILSNIILMAMKFIKKINTQEVDKIYLTTKSL